jgi:hypothetical protein
MAERAAGIELKIPRAKGIPEGSLISIRVGTVRRQAVYGSERPYKFQGPYSKSEMMKVDVYMPIAQATLFPFVDNAQNQGTWQIPLKVASVLSGNEKAADTNMTLDLDMKLEDSSKQVGDINKELEVQKVQAPDRPISALPKESSAKRHQVAIEAQPYFEQHEVLEVLRELLQVLIKDQPKDPYGFMIQVLENSRKKLAANAERKRVEQDLDAQKIQTKVDANVPSSTEPIKPDAAAQKDAVPESGVSKEAVAVEQPQESVQAPATPEPLQPKSTDATADPRSASDVAAPTSPPPVDPAPPQELPPPMPSVSTSSVGSKKDSQVSKEELAQIQTKVRSCLTQKVKDGVLEKILVDCGFGLLADEVTSAESAEMQLPPAKSPGAQSIATTQIEEVGRDDRDVFQANLDVAKECVAGFEARTVPRPQNGSPEELERIRERLHQKLAEKEASGQLEPLLRKLVDAEEKDANKGDRSVSAEEKAAAEETRRILKEAFVQKFVAGELNQVFDSVTAGCVVSEIRRSSWPSPSQPAESPREQASKELEMFRQRLRGSLISAVEKGSLPDLLLEAHSHCGLSKAVASNAEASPPAGASSASPGLAVQARYVGPAVGASSSGIPLGAVVSAGPIPSTAVQAAATPVQSTAEPKVRRQPSIGTEVDILKGHAQALDARTATLEGQIELLIRENQSLRQDLQVMSGADRTDRR